MYGSIQNKFVILRDAADGDRATDGGNGGGDAVTVPDGFVPKAQYEQDVSALNGKLAALATEKSGPIVAPDGTFKEGWTKELGEDFKQDDPFFQKFSGLKGMIKSHMALEKMVGANTVKIPSEHSTEEDRRIFNERMGIPNDANEYAYNPPENLPDGVTLEETELKQFQQAAKDLGFTKEQFQKLVDYDLQRQAGDLAAQKEAWENQKAQIAAEAKAELGVNGVTKATKVARWLSQKLTTDPNNPVDVMADPAIANSVIGLKLLAEVGNLFREGQLPTLPSELSIQDVQTQIDAIMNDANHPYHKGDPVAVQRMYELRRRKNMG